MTVPNPTTMHTEFTHPFEVPSSPENLADTQLLASIKDMEAALGSFRADGFDFRDWENWTQIRLKVWTLLKCQQELCRRRGLEFARNSGRASPSPRGATHLTAAVARALQRGR